MARRKLVNRPTAGSNPPPAQPQTGVLPISIGLAVITLALFARACGFEFVNYDDPLFVTDNAHVQGGFTWANIVWAFTNNDAYLWHPLTWFSHMLDWRLFGLKPGGHHFANILLHAASTVLLFLALRRMTGAAWRSAIVAALFAWHPLHVQSVAWIAERKDVLSGFFWMLTLWAYARYVEQPGARRYAMVLLSFALGLMAKPMGVTLPFVLLLLDVWPLRRIKLEVGAGHEAWKLVREKIPLFILAAVVSVVAVRMMEPTGAMMSTAGLPLSSRLANALVAYARYVGQVFWPVNLAAFYPLPPAWHGWEIAVAVLVLLVITVFVLRAFREHSFLAVGWLWFLGTLVPVSGLIQNGSQAMADRYTYVPYVGLFMALVWGVAALGQHWPQSAKLFSRAGIVALVACAGLTYWQLGHWRNSVTLYTRALQVTQNNAIAHNNLGSALEQQGRLGEAVEHYRAAVQAAPAYYTANKNLADALRLQGRDDEATPIYREILRHRPELAEVHASLGSALAKQNQLPEAEAEFRLALKHVESATVHNNLASLLAMKGRAEEAIVHYRAATRLKPDWEVPLNSLAWMLAVQPDPHLRDGPAAVQLAERACALTGRKDPLCLNTLAAAYAEVGRFADAVSTAQQARQLAVATGQADVARDIAGFLQRYQNNQPYREGAP